MATSRSRLTPAAGLLVGAIVLPFVVAAALTLALRSHSPLARRAIRQLNRAVLNPRNLRTAGEPGSRYSVVTHRGRRSGREHCTPVGATRTDDGFVVPLPYGDGTDWVRNLQADQGGTVLHDGREVRVIRPLVVPMTEVLGLFAPGEQRVLRGFRVSEALVLRADANA